MMTFSTEQIDPEATDASCGPDKKVWYVFFSIYKIIYHLPTTYQPIFFKNPVLMFLFSFFY